MTPFAKAAKRTGGRAAAQMLCLCFHVGPAMLGLSRCADGGPLYQRLWEVHRGPSAAAWVPIIWPIESHGCRFRFRQPIPDLVFLGVIGASLLGFQVGVAATDMLKYLPRHT